MQWFRKLIKQDDRVIADTPPVLDEPQLKTHHTPGRNTLGPLMERIYATNFQLTPSNFKAVGASGMDASIEDVSAVKAQYRFTTNSMSENQLAFFGSQGFIGYQLMAMLAQNWLINKACLQPAKDAVRKGFEISINDGTLVETDVIARLRDADERFDLTGNMIEYIYNQRIFGIRVCKFEVISTDPDYYEKPFNIDGVTPGSYRGMSQIDPYWITPELEGIAVNDPAARRFYKPTFWRVNGQRIHHTHLVITRGPDVPDVLKPTYRYGGLALTQQIYERVYAAERTANEAPMLAQSKRETVIHVDMDKAVANEARFEEKMTVWARFRNNWSVKPVGLNEKIEQFDTSLADLDDTIMTQYQLVASVAGIPVTKLMGMVPKGFNATGEYDEANYHEELETIQTELNKLVKRHHELVIRSEMATTPFKPVIVWNPLDTMTRKEAAEVRKLDAETGAALVSSGAIDGMDERARITEDKTSGYNGLPVPTDETIPDGDTPAPINA